MKLWDKITGNDMTRAFENFKERAIKLPTDYQKAWKEIEENIWCHSDFTGRNLMKIFDTALTMLEETAANGRKIEEVLGNDIKGFCLELVGDEKVDDFREKWRKQLNKSVEKKLNR